MSLVVGKKVDMGGQEENIGDEEEGEGASLGICLGFEELIVNNPGRLFVVRAKTKRRGETQLLLLCRVKMEDGRSLGGAYVPDGRFKGQWADLRGKMAAIGGRI